MNKKIIKIKMEAKNLEYFQEGLIKSLTSAKENKTSLEDLYKEGQNIEAELFEAHPGLWDKEGYVPLRDVLGFIETLNDSSTRQYHSQNRSSLQEYIDCLS